MKKRYLIAPAATLIIGLFIFLLFSLYPFSSLSVAWCDMKQQVIPLMIQFKDILLGKSDMFLNMQNAGGTSFFGVFLFFLSSPFSLLVLFMSPATLYKFINLIVLFKMAVAAFNFSFFLYKVYPKLSWLQNAAISVMYAFCGYTMLYFQNIVWLDTMYMFPLVMLGLYYIFTKGDIKLFVVSFSLSLIIQFYLSFMISVFILLFCTIYSFLCCKKDKRQNVLHLTATGAAASLFFTAFAWIPMLFQYFSSARGEEILKSLMTCSINTNWQTTITTVLCTGVIFAAIPAIFFVKFKSFRKICAYICVFILMIVPLFLEPVNRMWHTGSYQAFPSRYGFITVFVGLLIFAEILYSINDIPQNEILIKRNDTKTLIFFCLVFLILIGIEIYLFITKSTELSAYTRRLWVRDDQLSQSIKFTLPIIAVYFFAILLYRLSMIDKRRFSAVLCCAVVLEAVFTGGSFIGLAGNDITFNEEVLELSDKIEDTDVYRVKTEKKYFDINIVGSLSYNSLGHYTSFTDNDYHSLIKNLGYSSYWMEVSSVGGTKFTDYLLGNRYSIVSSSALQENSDVIFDNSKFSIVKNGTQNTGISYVFYGDTSNISELSDSERILVQNEMFRTLSGKNSDLVKKLQPDDLSNLTITQNEAVYSVQRENPEYTGVIYYRIPVTGKKTLYFDCFNEITTKLKEPINGSCNIYVNGDKIESDYPSQKSNGILNLGSYENEYVLVEIEVLKSINAKSFGLYEFNDSLFNEYIEESESCKTVQKKNSLIVNAYSLSESGNLLISVPYSEGFTATVNGKKADVNVVFDDLISVGLVAGENVVKLSYIPKGFTLGVIISLSAFTIFILFLFIKKKFKIDLIKESTKYNKFLTFLFLFLSAGVFILIYIFPFVIRFY